jgi:hypothetical protein
VLRWAPLAARRRPVPNVDLAGYIHEVIRMSVCPPCQPIEQQISDITQQIDAILNSPGYIQGPTDPHPGRPDPESLREVKNLWKQLGVLENQLTTCIITQCHGLPDMTATLAGTVTLTSTAMGTPFSASPSVRASLLFHKFDHSHYDILSITLSPSSTTRTFPVPIPFDGTITFTDVISVTPSPGGSGTFVAGTGPTAGTMTAAVGFTIHHMVTPPLPNLPGIPSTGDSTIAFNLLTSTPPGSAMDSAGDVTLAGTSTFMGGALDKSTGTLVVTGIVSPHP